MKNIGFSLLLGLGACTGVNVDNPTHLADMDSDVFVDVTSGELSVELSPRSSCPTLRSDLVATVDGNAMDVEDPGSSNGGCNDIILTYSSVGEGHHEVVLRDTSAAWVIDLDWDAQDAVWEITRCDGPASCAKVP